MSATVAFDDAQVRAGLAGLRHAALSPRPMLQAIGRYGVASTRRRFQAGRAPDGAPWKPSRNRTGKPLIDTGLMMRSLTEHADQSSVEWGSNRVQAAVHQFGAVIRAKNGRALRFKVGDRFVSVEKVTIPARPYLGVNAEDRTAIGRVALRHLAAAFAGTMGGAGQLGGEAS